MVPLFMRLAGRELRGGLRGFRVFLACLALGVMAIAGVGSVSRALLAGLERDGRLILAGEVDLRLVHHQASAEQLAFLRSSGRVSRTSEMRAMATPLKAAPKAEAGRQDADPAGFHRASQRLMVELKAVDRRYPLYGGLSVSTAGTPAGTPAGIAVGIPAGFDFRTETPLGRRDGLWGAFIDRSVQERLGLALGDRLGLGALEVEIRGFIDREPDRAISAFAFGPRVMIAWPAAMETGLVQPGSLIHYHYKIALPPGTDAAAWRAVLAERFPQAGWRVRGVRQATPGLQQFIRRGNLFLTLVGLTALLVGGVGIGNATRSYLEGRTGTIAVLKCLGASSGLIFRVYLAQILTLAGLGIGLGLLAGAAVPATLSLFLGDVLPAAPMLGLYPEPLLLATAFGLLTALAFSVLPLATAGAVQAAQLFRARVVPLSGATAPPGTTLLVAALMVTLATLAFIVNEASHFAFWFLLGAAISFALFRLLGALVVRLAARMRGLRHPAWRLAVANLHRPGAATPSVVLSLGLGLTLLVAVALIEGNLSREVQDTLPEAAPAFFFIDIQPHQTAAFDTLVAGFPGVAHSQRVPMVRARLVGVNDGPIDRLAIDPTVHWVLNGDRGLTYAAEPPANSPVVAGSWWPPDYAGAPLVSFDANIARGFGVTVGDRLTFNVLGRPVTATIANLRRIDWLTLGVNFIFIFDPGTLARAPHSHIAGVRVAPEAETALEQAVADRFPNVSTIRVKEALVVVNQMLAAIGRAVRTTAGLTLLAGLLVLAGAVIAGHQRRVEEAVILKVLGATRRDILGAYGLEYGLLGLITAVIAAGLGVVVAWAVLTWVMRTDFVFLPGTVATTALLGTVLTLALGLSGTWHALGRKPAPLLRNE